MSNTIAISATKLDKILKILTDIKQEVAALTEKVEDLEPLYGSDEWWEWSDKKALKSIREGKGIKIRNHKELDNFFRSL